MVSGNPKLLRDLESGVKCSGFQMEVFQEHRQELALEGRQGQLMQCPWKMDLGRRWDCEPRGDFMSTYILL